MHTLPSPQALPDGHRSCTAQAPPSARASGPVTTCTTARMVRGSTGLYLDAVFPAPKTSETIDHITAPELAFAELVVRPSCDDKVRRGGLLMTPVLHASTPKEAVSMGAKFVTRYWVCS